MRKTLYWYVPLTAALIATAIFAHGFYSFVSGDTGTPVNLPSPGAPAAPAPTTAMVPIILGDSLARGTGDETGLGIGGRLVDDLRGRRIPTKNVVNLAVDGARTADLLEQLTSRNVRLLLGESNVIIVSIGGNDLGGANRWVGGPAVSDAMIGQVLSRVTQAIEEIRQASPRARIFVIGLYNPYSAVPAGQRLSLLISDWNAKLVESFASDPNIVVVQTMDLFKWHDRLSLDRFHPGNEGYALIARRIADAL